MVRKVIIAVLSLAALCTMILWVGSYTRTAVYLVRGGRVPGWFILRHDKHPCGFLLEVSRGTVLWSRTYSASRPQGKRVWGGESFRYERGIGSYWIMQFPIWAAFASFAAYPVVAFSRLFLRRRHSRRYRLEHGLCVKCGYDLRATPERCPECGQNAGQLEATNGV